MAEERTYQGQVYRREGPGQPWVRVGGAQPQRQGGFIPDPYAATEQAIRTRRAEMDVPRTAADTVRAQAQARIEQETIADEIRRARAQAELAEAQAAAASAAPALEREKEDIQAQGRRDAAQRSGQTVLRSVTRALDLLDDVPQGGGVAGSTARRVQASIPGTAAYYIRQQVEDFQNNIGVQALQEMRDNSPTGGAMGNISEKQVQMLRDLMGSFDISQPVDVLRENLNQVNNNFLEIMYGTPAERERLVESGVMSPELAQQVEGAYRAVQFDEFGRPTGSGREAYVRDLEPAGYGATEASVPYPPEMEEEHAAWLRSRGGNIDPEDYVEFRQSLDRKYNRQSDPDDLREWARQAQDYASAGGDPASLGITPVNRDLTDGFLGEQFRNDIISNPWGAGAAGFANAGGFGIPSLFAGDQYAMMRDANPIASTVGEIGGGVTGALTGGGLLGQLARRVSNPRTASFLANPITADVGYGGIYGATQADDPLYGAAGGVAGALAGNYIGSQIGRRLPGAVGFRRPQDPLNRGERAVVNSGADMDSVAAALAQADSMGVPMTGADTAPELLSLAGAATRFSPTAGGTARNIMQERNLGQLGRYRQAIERDLGPIANIPQRSEDLIQQARQQAAPLYDQAYAAPGASSVQIDDLTSRPTFRQALQQAYREVADEGLDPTTLGFDLNDAGEVVLSRTPSWRTLDYVKRGLDNVIEAETDAINGISSAGRRAVSMKNDLLGRMDNVNPAYAQARAAYAGPAAERQMLREGQLAARENPDQLSLDVASLSPAQREQMRLGYQSQLSSNAGRLRDNSNPWGQLYTDDAAQRLGTLYPEDGVANLLAQRDLELQLAGNANRLIGNSMTAERQVADELFRAPPGVAGDVGQGIAETALFGGPWLSAGRGIANRLFRERAQASANAQNMQLADEVAALLLNPSPTASADALADVAARNAAYAQSLDEITNRALVRGGHVGAGVGGSIAGLLAR